jgi:hypothetical protein
MRRRCVRGPACLPIALRLFLSLSVLIGLASCPTDLLAGPNEGGVLLVHYSPTAAVPNDPTFVEGGLAACDSAIVQAPADSTILWHVYAAFPPESSPRLKVVTFGCEFDENSVAVLWSATRPGATEIRYEPSVYWPYTGSGTSIAFEEALTGEVNEIFVFAGYGYEGETFAVVAHPDHGGTFASDGVPSELDSIVDYGSLGFGSPGSRSCPEVEVPQQGGVGQPDVPQSPTDCVFPMNVRVAAVHSVVFKTRADSLVLTGTTVTFDWNEGDSLRLNGIPILPGRPALEPRFPESTYRRLYGRVPFVLAKVDSGMTWQEAAEAYSHDLDALTLRCWNLYLDLVARTGDRATAARLVRDALQTSPLVDPSSVDVTEPIDSHHFHVLHYSLIGQDAKYQLGFDRSGMGAAHPLTQEYVCSLVSDWAAAMASSSVPSRIVLSAGGGISASSLGHPR